jgi:hypothetical protein
MSATAPRIFTPRDFSDLTVQVNKAFENLNGKIASASTTGGVSDAAFAALTAQVANLTAVSGSDIETGGTGTSAPSQSSVTVVTDNETIQGNGNSANPIALIGPVALGNGGTGISQTGTQQITTSGNPILAGGNEAETALTIAGVTVDSVASWSLPNVPDPSWLTGVTVILVCTANTVTMYLVNGTAATITPVAQAVNIKVIL